MDQSAEHLREISSTLYKYHLDNFLCDVFVVTPDGNEVPAHSIVLSAVSIKLRAAFEKSDNSVKKNYIFKLYVTDCDVPTVEIVLQFVYTGAINLPHDMPFDITRILSAGQKLGLDSTKLASCLSALLCLADSSVMENLPPVILTDEDLCLEIVEKEHNGSSITHGTISTADEYSAHYSLELCGNSTSNNDVAFLPKRHLGNICTTASESDNKVMAIKEEWSDSDLLSKSMQSYETTDAEINASHVCEMCGECFQHLSELGDHQSKRHGTGRPMNCRHCGREFTRLRALEQHELRHKEGSSYTCKVCDIVFVSYSELTRHRRQQHTVIDSVPFHCDICDKDLNSAHERAAHRAMHRERVPCPECGKTFTLERSMRAHMMTFHSDKEIVKPFECDICGHSFVRANLLVIHRRTHTGEKPFQCEVCGRRFICRGDLNKHTRLHVDGYMYKCKICDREIKTSRESADHRRMHTSGIVCPICGKSFTRYMNMQAHVRGTHEGERRFKCEECGKTFVYAQNLRYHRKQHQGGGCRPGLLNDAQ